MEAQEKRGRGRPATGQTPKRYFRMDSDGWAMVEAAAAAKGQDVSTYIRSVLLANAARTVGRKKAL